MTWKFEKQTLSNHPIELEDREGVSFEVPEEILEATETGAGDEGAGIHPTDGASPTVEMADDVEIDVQIVEPPKRTCDS